MLAIMVWTYIALFTLCGAVLLVGAVSGIDVDGWLVRDAEGANDD